VPTTGVVIRDTPGVSMLKKKVPTKIDRGKGMDLIFEATLLKAAQLKKTLKKSNDADGDNEASDSEKTDSDEDENLNLNQNDDEEEEHE
nr:hypothetical protein [Tanacetum cinerariifolium]